MCAFFVLLMLAGCHSTSAKEVMDKESTFAERVASATLHWNLNPAGDAQLVVADESGGVLKKDVTGQLTFKSNPGEEPKSVPLVLDTKSGIATADGPDLGNEVTEVRYALVVSDKPMTGTLYVPKKGTAGLVESSKGEAKPAEDKPEHGGTIQVIDGKKYEVVGDSETGEMRVYLVDADGKQPKKLKLAIESDDPKIVELKWHADGYYVGEIGADKPPRKTTLVVVDQDDDVHVCVVGFRPGIVLLVDPHPVYWVKRDWDHPGLARGHYKGTIDGPPGQLKVHEQPEHVKIDVKSKPGKGSKIKVKAH